ncbi:MAG: hypothetical protein A2284_00525 [Deltaproteobacteria bacterium RIFOXYA12_FULL_61_11]|nr:MAG: hypothetical protein A2284_00525 [Deltaproteobacteria bacterium RIFOXYA12_FULL_61_11]
MKVLLWLIALVGLTVGCSEEETKLEIAFSMKLPEPATDAPVFLTADKVELKIYRKTNNRTTDPWLTLNIVTQGAVDLCDQTRTVCYQFKGRQDDFRLTVRVSSLLKRKTAKFEVRVLKGTEVLFDGTAGDYKYYPHFNELLTLTLVRKGGTAPVIEDPEGDDGTDPSGDPSQPEASPDPSETDPTEDPSDSDVTDDPEDSSDDLSADGSTTDPSNDPSTQDETSDPAQNDVTP